MYVCSCEEQPLKNLVFPHTYLIVVHTHRKMEPRGDFGQNFEVENALQWAAEVHQQQPITYCHEHTGNELQYPAPAAAILQPIDGPRDISLNLPPQSNNAVPPVVSQLENQSPEDTKFVKLLDAYTFSTSLEPLIAKNKPTFVKFVKIVNAHIKYQEDTWRSHLGHLETVQRVYSGSSNDEETLDDFSGLNQERFQPYRRGYPRGRSMSKVRGSSRLSGRSSRSSSVQNHGRVVLDKKMIDILFGGFENRVEVEKKDRTPYPTWCISSWTLL